MVSHRVIVTGGGTGGHIYPALAVAEILKDDPEVEAILYIGARGHQEEKLAVERGFKFIGFDVSGMPRGLSPRILVWPFEMTGAVLSARSCLKSFNPTVVLGTGGYAAAPPLMAAQILAVPYAVHEPDAHPGLVNKLFAGKAKLVSCGMSGAVDTLKSSRGRVVVNGNPVGKRFVNLLRRESACAVLGLNPELKTMLITGGSQGARALNEAVFAALPNLLELKPDLQIIHQVGEKNIAEFKERLDENVLRSNRYFVRDYFDDLSLGYAVSDFALCRSGAMTISEMAVTGCPAIFVPYPFGAADHQTHNARFVEASGGAVVIPQSSLTAESLISTVAGLLSSEERLQGMHRSMLALGKPQAAADLASQLKEVSTANQMKHRKENAVSTVDL
jgi:UDP-N-acetylglucosamine--N-acetylmuramyl-(pentapeptide) pyrophosphoryl-undecaprenol N-acetylglucosamine transferase